MLTGGCLRAPLPLAIQTLRELNEELEENHLATEKQLQDEVDFKDTIIRTQVRVARGIVDVTDCGRCRRSCGRPRPRLHRLGC